ncbi:acyltransferase [Mucilaginibacter robiniae]|uniref:Acyltransferase n=1 Tax=Mucilaginibacter robiniae TaxID=2728022 RepID=A0A7L5E266_9SPHI|nr:acyltransferase [Mucilaginibacter robiniae]
MILEYAGTTLPKLKPNPIKISTPVESRRQEYPFINLIRFLSMMGIVWAHNKVFSPYEIDPLPKVDHANICIYFYQIFKFSVLCFFIISGFLLGSKIDHDSPKNYFIRRLTTTLKPYAVAFIILFSIVFIRVFLLHHDQDQLKTVGGILHFCFLSSHLWYLPNYLICLSVLFCFHKLVNKVSFGLILLGITLVYSIATVYIKQFELSHTSALFAFVFYLWLGVYIRKSNFVQKIYMMNPWLLLGLVIATYIISSVESCYLYKHQLNFFSVLRLGNQLYAICMFMFLVRVCPKAPKFGFFNPRAETYGIYLYHGTIMYYVFPKLIIWADQYLGVQIYTYKALVYVPLAIASFFVSYLTTVVFVKFLLRYNLAYLKLGN